MAEEKRKRIRKSPKVARSLGAPSVRFASKSFRVCEFVPTFTSLSVCVSVCLSVCV